MDTVIDTDGGVDDAISIIVALECTKIIGITTVCGNVDVGEATRNMKLITALCGRKVPIYSGSSGPLVPGFETFRYYGHGSDGLGDFIPSAHFKTFRELYLSDVDLTVKDPEGEEGAVSALVRLASSSQNTLQIIALGPLTNIALAICLDPKFLSRLHSLVIMGASLLGRGNSNRTSEFNCHYDPESFHIVLNAAHKLQRERCKNGPCKPLLTIVPWETTVETGLSWTVYDELVQKWSVAPLKPYSLFLKSILELMEKASRSIYKRLDGTSRTYHEEYLFQAHSFVLPDLYAVLAALFESEAVLETTDWDVKVELQGIGTRGMTHVEWWGSQKLGDLGVRNARVVTKMSKSFTEKMLKKVFMVPASTIENLSKESSHSSPKLGGMQPLLSPQISSSNIGMTLKPSPLPSQLVSAVSNEVLETLLTSGSVMIKYPNSATSRPAQRKIKVSLSTMELTWDSKKKAKVSSSLDLHSIKEIRMGMNTKAFEVHGKRPDWEDRAFSIIYTDSTTPGYKKLNLVAANAEECLYWVTGLHMLMTQVNLATDDVQLNMTNWLRSVWSIADSQGTGLLDLDQLSSLMPRVNVHLSKSEIKSALKIANVPKTGYLTFEAFERLYRILRFRPEIAELFSQLSLVKPFTITFEEFRRFLLDTQKMNWNEERCQETYEKFSSVGTKDMDMDHFTAFLISSTNHVFKKSCRDVYQDMTLPLNSYYVNTSHNTYLLGDQLTSESSIEGYIRALQRGCRCVELDIWDGPNGQPIIYHGRTLTSKIWFKDALETISKYAFLASPYPLILSFETHCCVEQQIVVAKTLQDVLGDMLLLKPLDSSGKLLPSPDRLKHKILVKAKCGSVVFPVSLEEPFDEDELENPTDLNFNLDAKSKSTNSSPFPGNDTLRRRATSTATNAVKSLGVCPAFADLVVYCKGTTLSGISLFPDLLPFDHLYSMTEKKANTILAKKRGDMELLNRSHLNRVYPSIIRFDSSNFDPIPHWISGSSLVALNFQTYDRPMQLSSALFEDNGGCGYVLKPSRLRDPTAKPLGPLQVTIKFISGQQIPKQKEARLNSNHEGSSIPTVEVEFTSDMEIVRFKTRSKRGNPANPIWKESFTTNVKNPDLAFVRFTVSENETLGVDVLGVYTVPLVCLEQGYRHIPLHNKQGDRLRFSTLFVCISIEDAGRDSGVPQLPPISSLGLQDTLSKDVLSTSETAVQDWPPNETLALQ